MDRLFIDNPDALRRLCSDLQGVSHLALDTEFLREKTYFPRLCLLQVCGNGIAACIDVLALDDLSPFLELLQSPDTVKVWHAARQDLEIFHHQWNLLPQPLFDTQLAAAVLGIGDQLGYASLVQQVLGVQLPKEQSRSDWCARPLEGSQLDYAYDDVIYLDRLYLELSGRLAQSGRSGWLDEDFAALVDPATYRTEPADAWQRVKGRQHLKGGRLAVLQALAAWREEQAVARDKPRRWVIKDEVMVDIARRRADSQDQLSRIRGFDERTLTRDGRAIVDVVKRGLEVPKEAWPSEKVPPPLSASQEVIVDLLSAVVRLVADEQQVTAAALASRRDLAKLVVGVDGPLDHGWRRKLVGDLLNRVLNGEQAVRINDGRPELVAC